VRQVNSLRGRLTVALLLMFLIGLGAALIFSHREAWKEEKQLQETILRSEACEYLAALDISSGGEIAVSLPPPIWPHDANVTYTLYDGHRQPVALSPGLSQPLPFLKVSGPDACGHLRRVEPEKQMVLAARAPGGHTLVMAMAEPHGLPVLEIFLYEVSELTAVFVPFALASFALIWLIGRWSLLPVGRAAREAAGIGPANPSGRISVASLPSELGPLVKAVNGALERLDQAYGTQRRLTADAAHELRTPLAVLSLRLQRAKLDAVVDWPALESDLAQMSRLVGQLLDLARKEDPTRRNDPACLRPVNLSRIVREAAAAVLPLAEAKGRSLEIEAPDAVPANGRPDDLRDAVRNLLDNALVHGEGTIRVTVSEQHDGTHAVASIEVADEGPGIAEGLRDLVFERFRKAVPTSPGAGLGLAIVREVARAHGGEVRVEPGPGCRIQLFLPLQGQLVSRPVGSSDSQGSPDV
jgi:two-component system sensor histidine kinase TctE